MAVCPNCKGEKKKFEELKFGIRITTCPSCNGLGSVAPSLAKKKVCSACNGLGYVYADPEGFKKGFIGSKTHCKACNSTGLV
jgi:DnaJ-class molecular chaperone